MDSKGGLNPIWKGLADLPRWMKLSLLELIGLYPRLGWVVVISSELLAV
jgi:hypothetical protein